MPDAPRRVVVDSGPLIALFDASDSYHQRALDFARRSRATWISTLAVITEAMYVLSESLLAQKNLLTWIREGGLTLIELEAAELDRVIELLEKYSDLPMDFTDAVLVALCERLDIIHIASVDRDFTVYRFKGRAKFNNLFLA